MKLVTGLAGLAQNGLHDEHVFKVWLNQENKTPLCATPMIPFRWMLREREVTGHWSTGGNQVGFRYRLILKAAGLPSSRMCR